MLKALVVWITTNYGKFLERRFTYLLRNLYAGQETTVITRHGTMDWFQIGKRVHQGCILSPCLFNLYVEYIMQNAGLDESQTGINWINCDITIKKKRLLGEISITSDKQMTPPPYGRKWRGTKEPLDEGERDNEKACLKCNTQKAKIMASGVPTLNANRWGKSESSDRFYFLGLKNHYGQWLQPWN